MRRLLSFILAGLILLALSAGVCSSVPFTRTDSDGEVFSWVNNDKKMIALTFDDGPHPSYTEEILDVLRENGVRATFFVIGENAEKRTELIKEIENGRNCSIKLVFRSSAYMGIMKSGRSISLPIMK